MTKTNMIKLIEYKFKRMDWFINHHQEKADYFQSEARLLLDNTEGMTYTEYETSDAMRKYKSHSCIVREYKAKKDLLNNILVEITGNFYGEKESQYNVD
tara:strand:- start:870 stop:1166 length:297 start_codon:yes stop_codon:yes gene_type:complete